jgi:preprotein translocase subunit SecA
MILAKLFSALSRTRNEQNFNRPAKKRSYLFEFDDVLNEREEFIRGQKECILHDSRLKERLKRAAAELTGDIIEFFNNGWWCEFTSPLENLQINLRRNLGYRLAVDIDSEELFHTELLYKRVVEDLERTVDEREKIIGPDNLNIFIRDLYMSVIDAEWEDFLARMKTARDYFCLREDGKNNFPDEYRMDESGMLKETQKEAARKFFLTPPDVFRKYNECFGIV